MNNVIYMTQISENKSFTKIFFNKIFADKKMALSSYKITESMCKEREIKYYCRLIEINFQDGFGYDGDGIEIRKNY